MVNAITTNYCTMQLANKCKKKHGVLPMADFYTASNTTFYNNGKFNICKHCLKEYLYDGDEININKFKNILRIFDLPFLEKEYTSAVEGKNETFGTYMKNIMLNHKGEGWLDGDNVTNDKVIKPTISKNHSSYELAKKWGIGFSEEDLQWLEETYLEWTSENDCHKLSAKKLVKMICIKELEIRKAIEAGQATDKLEKSLLDLMNNSNLTPKTMSASNEDDGSKSWGEFIRDIEMYRPCEYFEDKDIYKDESNIMEYYNRFILRPMKNLLLGNREFDKEFNVEDEK